MQIAGRSCTKCSIAVFSVLDGRGCAACGLVFHAACLEAPDTCPRCQRLFAVTTAAAAAVEQQADARAHDRREALRWTVTGLASAALIAVTAFAARSMTGRSSADAELFIGKGVQWTAVGVVFVTAAAIAPTLPWFKKSPLGMRQARLFGLLVGVCWLCLGALSLSHARG